MTNAGSRSREGLHAAAEWLLAGPQYARAGTIRLAVTDAGVATVDGVASIDPDGLKIVVDDAESRTPWASTLREMAAAAGIHPEIPQDLYADHASLGLDDRLELDVKEMQRLIEWFGEGERGLTTFAPSEEPVLWPEHFDLAITVAEVNFGVSLGDEHYQQPYAYVGPWTMREGDFWNAPFGAVRTAVDLPHGAAIAEFFAEGARQAAR